MFDKIFTEMAAIFDFVVEILKGVLMKTLEFMIQV